MAHEQQIDLILRALYQSGTGIVSATSLESFEGSGSVGTIISPGLGSPVLVGRNSALQLTLDVLDIPQAGTLDVSIETAASPGALSWRKLGAFPTQSVTGSPTLSLAGADAWVRARYTISPGSAFALGLGGRALSVLLAAGAISGPGASSPVDLAQYRSARMTADVPSISGTLTVVLETAGSSTAAVWRPCSAVVTLSGAASADLAAVNLDRYLRVRWTLTGTATLGVAGVARLVLAQPSDRARLGIVGGAFPDSTIEEDDDALYAATADVIGPWESRYVMPPRAWQDDVREACVRIADWKKIASRGTEPGKRLSSEETVFYERYIYYMGNPHSATTLGSSGWIQRVASKTANPSAFLDSATPDPVDGKLERMAIASEPLRGWGRRSAVPGW